MKEAQRLFSQNKTPPKMSPSFKSNVKRFKIVPNQSFVPGVGKYEITLPLVKPKYEAILKKNRSIIIKINDTPSIAFISQEPRFKQFKTVENPELRQWKEDEKRLRNGKRYNFGLARKEGINYLSQRIEEKQVQKIKGSKWYKQKGKRSIWNNSKNSMVGPGSYNWEEVGSKLTIEENHNPSWQFKSHSKRQQKEDLNHKERLICKSMDGSSEHIPIHSRVNL